MMHPDASMHPITHPNPRRTGEAIRSDAAPLWLIVIMLAGFFAWGSESGQAGNTYILGGSMLHNIRRGYHVWGEKTQMSEPQPLHLWGVIIGKQYPLKHSLRLQISGMLDFGGIDLDTIDNMSLSDGSTHELALVHSLLHLSGVPEVQYVFPQINGYSPFLRMGMGVNYVRIREEGRINDEGFFRRAVEIPGGIEGSRWSVALQGGLGIEIPIKSGWNLSAAYAYRYWHPVHYDYTTDLPLRAVPYRESFRTHMVQLQLGIPEGKPEG